VRDQIRCSFESAQRFEENEDGIRMCGIFKTSGSFEVNCEIAFAVKDHVLCIEADNRQIEEGGNRE